MSTINIGKDFSDDPNGRFYTDGDFSGEAFREEHLLPHLKKLAMNEKLNIIIDDNVEGYGSSFLVEGFAGVVKYGHMTSEELLSKINIICSNPDFVFYKNKIQEYILDANYKSQVYNSTKRK